MIFQQVNFLQGLRFCQIYWKIDLDSLVISNILEMGAKYPGVQETVLVKTE